MPRSRTGRGHVWTCAALADLELGAGRLPSALEHLREQQAILDRLGIDDVDLSPVPDLVEILVRLGEQAQAGSLIEPYGRPATAKGQPWSGAWAARCTGLLAADDALDPPFRRALALHTKTPDVFEQARTQLAYGARLRRVRRRIDAREQLRAALATFETLGALPGSSRPPPSLPRPVRRPRRRDVSTLDQLTAREMQVELLLSRGMTTRVAAGQLFLSPRRSSTACATSTRSSGSVHGMNWPRSFRVRQTWSTAPSAAGPQRAVSSWTIGRIGVDGVVFVFTVLTPDAPINRSRTA